MITLARYVDDILASSYWLCKDCVNNVVDRIYANTVSFDAACEGQPKLQIFNIIKLLDLWVYLDWNKFICWPSL